MLVKATIEGNLDLDGSILDVNDSNGVGVCRTDYRLASVGTGVLGDHQVFRQREHYM